MKIIHAMIIAFGMYSHIPMPRIKWNEDSLSYAFCFFPMVGVAVGALLFLWMKLSLFISVGNILFGAVAVFIPIAVTGGIHLDGFCDTVDALASHQDREKKLEILKDSHTGAFAIIWCVIYLLLFTAFWSEVGLSFPTMVVLSLTPVISRSFSGFAAVSFQNARGSGMLATFSKASTEKTVRFSCILWGVLAVALAIYISLIEGVAVVFTALLVFLYYRLMSTKQFGGITGDLEGWFLQMAELFMVLAVVAVQKIGGVI